MSQTKQNFLLCSNSSLKKQLLLQLFLNFKKVSHLPMETICVIPKDLITLGFRACSKLPRKRDEAITEHGIHGTEMDSSLWFLAGIIPFPVIPFPVIPFPVIPFPAIPFPVIPFPAVPFPVPFLIKPFGWDFELPFERRFLLLMDSS